VCGAPQVQLWQQALDGAWRRVSCITGTPTRGEQVD
jgi:hypothetical protein